MQLRCLRHLHCTKTISTRSSVRSGEKEKVMMVKIIKDISEDYNLCKDCEHNESADEEYSAKLICGKHSKIVDVRDEACVDYEERGDNNDTE